MLSTESTTELNPKEKKLVKRPGLYDFKKVELHTCILLSIVTFGIYIIFWFANKINKVNEGRKWSLADVVHIIPGYSKIN